MHVGGQLSGLLAGKEFVDVVVGCSDSVGLVYSAEASYPSVVRNWADESDMVEELLVEVLRTHCCRPAAAEPVDTGSFALHKRSVQRFAAELVLELPEQPEQLSVGSWPRHAAAVARQVRVVCLMES